MIHIYSEMALLSQVHYLYAESPDLFESLELNNLFYFSADMHLFPKDQNMPTKRKIASHTFARLEY